MASFNIFSQKLINGSLYEYLVYIDDLRPLLTWEAGSGSIGNLLTSFSVSLIKGIQCWYNIVIEKQLFFY